MKSWQGILRRLVGSPARRDDYERLVSEPWLSDTTLPTSSGGPRRRSARCMARLHIPFLTLRRILIVLALTPLVLFIGVLWSGIPPSYQDVRIYEKQLPQHNLTEAEARGVKYLRLSGFIWGHGLNNILQEAILMSYLAYETERAYVFDDYVWSQSPFPYAVYDFALRPNRIPLNAFISGPTAGGPTTGPRAVNAQFWELACPVEKRVTLSSKGAPTWSEGREIVDWWAARIRAVPAPCVEIDSSEQIVFDRFLFGDTRILSLWEGLAASPVLRGFAWSPLVQAAVLRNFAVLQPPTPRALADDAAPLPGLVAVHVRRGDFERHCRNLGTWGAVYMGFNQHPALPDRFDATPPAGVADDDADVDAWREAHYLRHCLPTVEEIVRRMREVRTGRPGLRRAYVLTNAGAGWVRGLRGALAADGWDAVASGVDAVLDAEQAYVGMAVDMAIAERAEVFLGNGFSSLTSNIVMLRMAKGMDPASNRFL